MATINLNISQNDTININVVSSDSKSDNANGLSKDELFDRLYKDLVKSNKMKKHLWYEVFCDFADDFDGKIYPIIKDMPYEIAFTYCWGYLVQQDEYYRSEQYIRDLDSMLRNN